MNQLGFTPNYQPSANTGIFPDPFADYGSLVMPRTIADALSWSEYVFMSNGTYREAMRRVVAYFVTGIEIVGNGSDEEKNKSQKFFVESLKAISVCYNAGMDLGCYGNGFYSILLPFQRHISCPKCHSETSLKAAYDNPEFKLKWELPNLSATCPKCHYSGIWHDLENPPHDRRTSEDDKITIKRWNPHEIDILHDEYSGASQYIWKIPQSYRRQLKEGRLFHLENVHWDVIKAVAADENLLFDKDTIYHMKEETLSGVRSHGWGISKTITNFRQARYLQVLVRANEAVAMDYVLPFRVLTPMVRPGGGEGVSDPSLTVNLAGFRAQIMRMLQKHRLDPAMWHVLSYPIQYSALGGDAKNLMTPDLINQGLEKLLNDIGVPIELYRGSLRVEAAPVALRLFEGIWNPLIEALNGLLAWISKKIVAMLSWEDTTARLMKTTYVDDISKQMTQLQLMMGGQISQTTGLKAIGNDFREELRRRLQEQQIVAEETERMQEELERAGIGKAMLQSANPMMQMQQQAQGAPPGGPQAAGGPMPPIGGPTPPDVPVSPQDMMSQAQSLAQQMLSLPESQKDSQLIQLKRSDPTMHSLVRSEMDNIRQQAQSQGGAAVLAQQFPQQMPTA